MAKIDCGPFSVDGVPRKDGPADCQIGRLKESQGATRLGSSRLGVQEETRFVVEKLAVLNIGRKPTARHIGTDEGDFLCEVAKDGTTTVNGDVGPKA